MIKEPKKSNMREVLGANKLSIPEYQRGYAWTAEEIGEYVDDIKDLWERGKSEHFFGSILCYLNSHKVFLTSVEIIDGQQRLTTTSMLLAAMRQGATLLANHKDTRGVDKVAAELIVETCGKCLVREKDGEQHALLSLSEKDDPHWRRLVLEGHRLSKQDKVPASVVRIDKAYQKLYEEVVAPLLASLSSPEDNARAVKELRQRLDAVLDRLILIVLTAEDHNDVYDMFMTVNDRGKPLSVTDLLRTDVLRRLKHDNQKFRMANTYFSPLLDVDDNEAKRALSHYVNSLEGKRIPKSKLLMKAYKVLNEGDKAAGFAAKLVSRAECMCAGTEFMLKLQSKKPKWFGDAYPFEGDKLGAERQHRVVAALRNESAKPLLVAGRECLDAKTYRAMLGVLERIATRAFICDALHPNDIADFYIEHAKWMRDGGWSPTEMWRLARANESPDGRHVLELQALCSDAVFKEGVLALRYKGGRSMIAYLLLGIDSYDFQADEPANVQSFHWEAIHLDHICPQSSKDDPVVSTGLVHTIGNLTPIGGTKNQKMSNKPFGSEKATYYRNSRIPMTVELSEMDEWTPEDVRRRSEMIADKAVKVWSLGDKLWI